MLATDVTEIALGKGQGFMGLYVLSATWFPGMHGHTKGHTASLCCDRMACCGSCFSRRQLWMGEKVSGTKISHKDAKIRNGLSR